MRSYRHQFPGIVTFDHEFQVPLDYSDPSEGSITVFAREVVAADKETDNLPLMVFLQGGPGGASPRPLNGGGWFERVLKDYRLILLDQRGTGRSTPVTSQSIASKGSDEDRAEYLTHFRADSIVRDCELIRRDLIGDDKWSLLGQSFGGWCITNYLSFYPEGVREAYYTGGLPSITAAAEDVYRRTYPRVAERNRRYYQRYPEDEPLVRKIVARLQGGIKEVTPSGDLVTPHRLQLIGSEMGFSDGADRIHYLLEEAFDGDDLTYEFLAGLDQMANFNQGPIFAVLHEPIYCQGNASKWAANRVRAEFPEFEASPDKTVFFTGEMIYPWMFNEFRNLRNFKGAAEILAEKSDWPILYDAEQLARNEVPCAAAVYYDDMFVDANLSLETASKMGNVKVWVTNEFEHCGLRMHGAKVLDRLFGLNRGLI